MKRTIFCALLLLLVSLSFAQTNKTTATKEIVRKPKVIPVPEYINQPYYYDFDNDRLIKLEKASAFITTRKKTFGLNGTKQLYVLDGGTSRVRFTSFVLQTNSSSQEITIFGFGIDWRRSD